MLHIKQTMMHNVDVKHVEVHYTITIISRREYCLTYSSHTVQKVYSNWNVCVMW